MCQTCTKVRLQLKFTFFLKKSLTWTSPKLYTYYYHYHSKVLVERNNKCAVKFNNCWQKIRRQHWMTTIGIKYLRTNFKSKQSLHALAMILVLKSKKIRCSWCIQIYVKYKAFEALPHSLFNNLFFQIWLNMLLKRNKRSA